MLCSGFLGLLAFGLCAFNEGDPVWAAVPLIVSGVCLAGLLHRQAQQPAPILAVDLLRRPIIGLSSLTSICAFMTQALAFVSLPFFLQTDLGISLVTTGIVLTAWPVVVAVMAAIVSPLSDRYPPGILCSVGLMMLCIGMLSVATLSPGATDTMIGLRLVICGAGFGLFQAPNMKAIMGNAPKSRSGGASGIIAISRILGQTCGATLVAECFRLFPAQGAEMALWLGCLTAGIGTLISLARLTTSSDTDRP